MKLGTANLRNFPDMTPHQVAQDARTVASSTSVCGLQEIQVGEDTPVVREALPDHWDLIGGKGTSPIVWNTRKWKVTDHRARRHRRPHLSRVENPFLDVTTVLLSSVKRPHLPPFAVVNTHLVSGGYNAQHLPDVKAQWDKEWILVSREVYSLWDKELTVYLVGDLNNPHPPRLTPGRHFTWLSPQGPGPDHLGELEHPLSVQLTGYTHQALQLNSDHQLHVVSGSLRR